jgi:hypothetical protein
MTPPRDVKDGHEPTRASRLDQADVLFAREARRVRTMTRRLPAGVLGWEIRALTFSSRAIRSARNSLCASINSMLELISRRVLPGANSFSVSMKRSVTLFCN